MRHASTHPFPRKIGGRRILAGSAMRCYNQTLTEEGAIMNDRITLAAAGLLSLALVQGAQAKALDAGLFTQYEGSNGTQMIYDVCGSVGDTSGCYGGDILQPFEHACAVIEGAAETDGNVMTRDIYVF